MWDWIGVIFIVLAIAISNLPRPAEAVTTDQVLGQLDQVGRNLKEFSAQVRLTETDALGGNVVHVGRAFFQKKPDGNARMHIIFDQRIAGNRISTDEKTEYLLDGRWLTDRNYRSHNETVREVLREGQKMDLFKLGEGPFPLPIGQDPAEVHRLFEVKKIEPDKGDPRNSAHLQLLPKNDTDLARKFHSIDVWVDQQTHMPVRVDTQDTKQQNFHSTDLTDIVLNPPGGLKEADFQLPPIDESTWSFSKESLSQ